MNNIFIFIIHYYFYYSLLFFINIIIIINYPNYQLIIDHVFIYYYD